MVGARITYSGFDRAIAILEGTSGAADNMDLAWAKVHNLLNSISKNQIQYGGQRGPNKWANLNPVTIARKRRDGYRLKKMYRTERTADSLAKRNDPDHVWRVVPSSNTAFYGSKTDAFAAQMEEVGERPFRPPVDLNEEDVTKVAKILMDHVMSGAASKQARILGRITQAVD